jgi:cytochrome c oxidase cbb3-type subunit I/II
MINGLLTLRGAWDRVRDSAVLKFFVVGVTAYGMSTFEGPMLSLKSVNAISHFTDWTIAHVHIGGMGWNGFMIFGMIYWLWPRIFNTKLKSESLANTHFWIGTLGMIFYAVPLYWAAITQVLMWNEFKPDGMLAYTNFMDTVTEILPMYYFRAFGGLLYLTGFLLFIYNVMATARSGKLVAEEEATAPALEPMPKGRVAGETPHRWVERRWVPFTIWAFVAIAIGTVIELIPGFMVKSNVPTISSVTPYTPLELAGRDIYVREGCYTCHSQQVRPFRAETSRYGKYSKAGEFVYDRPYQWGSRRMGPDLAREGVKNGPIAYKDAYWHYKHMLRPQDLIQTSVMPAYPWLITDQIDMEVMPAKIRAMQTLGVPYPDGYDKIVMDEMMKQAKGIAADLKAKGVEVKPDREIIAMIAYLHRLGADIYKTETASK